MNKIEMRDAFIKATINIIANEGIDKTTTKRISDVAGGLNESYIYRIFKSKENLYKESFLTASKKLNHKFLELVSLLQTSNISPEDQWWLFITGFWNIVYQHQNQCKCYLHYSCSPYYHKWALDEHQVQYQDIIQAFERIFHKGTNIELLYNYIFNTVLYFVFQEINSETKTGIKTAEQVYELIYSVIKPHLLQQA